MAVEVLGLLQQHVVEHSGDVNLHIILDGLQHCHVGPHAGEQLWWFGNLLCGLVVHGHPDYGPERQLQKWSVNELNNKNEPPLLTLAYVSGFIAQLEQTGYFCNILSKCILLHRKNSSADVIKTKQQEKKNIYIKNK